MCERWMKFEDFLIDMGERPTNTTIDRINNEGNYEPGNCRWATRAEQANNKRNVKLYPYQNQMVTLSAIAQQYNLKHKMLWERLHCGWTLDKAIITPPKKARLGTHTDKDDKEHPRDGEA